MTVEPMTDAEVDRLRLTANAKWIDRGGMWMRPIDVLDLIARIDAAEAERDAALARAMPAPRLMRTVEEVEALPDGLYLCAIPNFRPEVLIVREGRFFTCGYVYRAAEFTGREFRGPLPDLPTPTPTAAQEGCNND